MTKIKMTKIKIASCLICILVCQSSFAMFGDGDASNGIEDNRTELNRAAPFKQAIGSIFCDGAVRGTGTLVSMPLLHAQPKPDVILLSAAHILFSETGDKYQTCVFQIGGDPYRTLAFTDKQYFANEFDPHKSDLKNNESDWALSKLNNPYDIHLQPMDVHPPNLNPSIDTVLVAWNSGSQQLTEISQIAIEWPNKDNLAEGSNRLLLHNGDSNNGASGGAIIQFIDHKPWLVGIHIGRLWRGSLDDEQPPVWGSQYDPMTYAASFIVINQHIQNSLKTFTNH